jgi:hypothetical protein
MKGKVDWVLFPIRVAILFRFLPFSQNHCQLFKDLLLHIDPKRLQLTNRTILQGSISIGWKSKPSYLMSSQPRKTQKTPRLLHSFRTTWVDLSQTAIRILMVIQMFKGPKVQAHHWQSWERSYQMDWTWGKLWVHREDWASPSEPPTSPLIFYHLAAILFWQV